MALVLVVVRIVSGGAALSVGGLAGPAATAQSPPNLDPLSPL
jgi:hypothetical protein